MTKANNINHPFPKTLTPQIIMKSKKNKNPQPSTYIQVDLFAPLPPKKRISSKNFLFENLPPITLIVHGCRHLDEAGNVTARDQTWELAVLGLDVFLSRL